MLGCAALATEIQYPDRADADDDVEIAYWLDGRPNTRTLQQLSGEGSRTEITFVYDGTFRRLTQRNLTTAGGVDTTASSITTTYDSLGRREYVTSHTDSSPDTTTFADALNQVQYTYNDLGQREKEYQEHEGKVDEYTLYVQYNYDDTDSTPDDGVFDKAMRPKSLRYPSYSSNHYTRTAGEVAARLLHSLYIDAGGGSGIGDAISRVTALSNEATRADEDEVYSAYDYNGAGRLVVEDYVQPDVRLDYWGQTNDTYGGFDRFGRIKQQLWTDCGPNPDEDRDKFTYGHDRNSNRLYRENTGTADLDELYAYDNLSRLTTSHRGDLDGDKDEIPVADREHGEAWDLTPTGNWEDYQIDANGDGDFTDASDLDQDRTHNLVNEITGITEQSDPQQSQWADPVWSARGNMTGVPKPSDLTATYTATYDAWNRLVEVKSGANVVLKCEYDGLGRRTKKHINTGVDQVYDEFRHFFYNASWQILETRKATNVATEPQTLQPEYQYVWSLRYIDAPVLRDENTDEDDLCDDETLYYLTDANFNVTCLTDTGGDAVERYVYDPYGKVTVYNNNWSATVAWAASKKNNVRYCGYYFDNETGLYHVRNRHYHPTLGRWVTRDPIGYVDALSLYGYVDGNPIGAVDSHGLRSLLGFKRTAAQILNLVINEIVGYVGPDSLRRHASSAPSIPECKGEVAYWIVSGHTLADRYTGGLTFTFRLDYYWHGIRFWRTYLARVSVTWEASIDVKYTVLWECCCDDRLAVIAGLRVDKAVVTLKGEQTIIPALFGGPRFPEPLGKTYPLLGKASRDVTQRLKNTVDYKVLGCDEKTGKRKTRKDVAR